PEARVLDASDAVSADDGMSPTLIGANPTRTYLEIPPDSTTDVKVGVRTLVTAIAGAIWVQAGVGVALTGGAPGGGGEIPAGESAWLVKTAADTWVMQSLVTDNPITATDVLSGGDDADIDGRSWDN